MIFGGLTAILFFLSANFSAAQVLPADTLPWRITSFDSVIDLHENTDFTVTEKISATFNEQRHGIFRYIPLKYSTAGIFNYFLKINLEGIYKPDNSAWNFERTQSGNFWEYKIGSPDELIGGQQRFDIIYDVSRGIRFFDDHDELYWNVTGNDWEAPIAKATATVLLPKQISKQDLNFKCYTGLAGAVAEDCNYIFDEDAKTIAFSTFDQPNAMDNYLTVAISFPKGYLTEYSKSKKIGIFLGDNYPIFLPIFAFILMYFWWLKKGKDEKPNKPVIAQYEGADLMTPSLVPVIEKEKMFSPRDLPAELVHLATLRILKIKEINAEKGEYEIIKNREWADNAKITAYQKLLLDKIFAGGSETVKLADLKEKFDYKDSAAYIKSAKDYIEEKKYYVNPVATKGLFILLGMFILGAGIIFGAGAQNMALFLGCVVSAIIVIVFGIFMPKKSKEGMDMLWHVKGLKEYINVAEKDRIKGEEAANIFSKVLPFAMVMGMTEKWVTVFDGILKQPPEWLEVQNPNVFAIPYLYTALNGFESQANKGFAPAYQSGGSSGSSGFSGGSSGGGFGGGGGGSW